MGSNARLGKSQYLVAEADESDRSFLKLSPILSVVTNIDREHMDCYRDMEDVEATFINFMDRVPFYGMVVACNDDDRLRALLPRIQRRAVTYGTREGSDFRVHFDGCPTLVAPGVGATEPALSLSKGWGDSAMNRFRVDFGGRGLGEFQLHVPGAHNVLNAAAAIAVGIGLDIAPEKIREALGAFRGVDRRFQVRGQAAGVIVIDDYGHHPTEIRATLAAARQCGFGRIHVLFQPHRYTRTQALMDEFAGAFADADTLFILDIYPASEAPIPGVTAQNLARRIAQGGRAATYVASFADATAAVTSIARPGDMILTLGAGSISQFAPQVVEALSAKESSATAG
jgi:UDP-N-acetylmuramate--alanine ligase